jgi:hypothetical protein
VKEEEKLQRRGLLRLGTILAAYGRLDQVPGHGLADQVG